MHGYTTVFYIAAGVLILVAVVAAALIRPGVVEIDPGAAPVMAN